MPEFFVDAVLVQQQNYTIRIQADSIDKAREKATEIEHDMNTIANMVDADFDPGDGWLELDTLRDREDA